MRSFRPLFIVGLAALLCLLNAPKPLHIDDTAYYFFARQIAEKPLDPYGFDLHWYEEPWPAFWILAPLVLPYWLALGMKLFGDDPFLWKLWLFPFALILVWALDALFRRFAKGQEKPLVLMTVLSPAILPSFNLMLDVPALALALAAVATFLRAWERQSATLAALAGLTAGLAMQTKYTGVLAACAIYLATVLFGIVRPAIRAFWQRPLAPLLIPYRRILLGLLAMSVAGTLFAFWEWYLYRSYGHSHFLFHLRYGGSFKGREHFILPMVTILGGLAPVVMLLGWAGLTWPSRATGRRGWIIAGACGLVGVGIIAALFGLLAALPPLVFTYDSTGNQPRLTLNNSIFGSLGILFITTLLLVEFRLWQLGRFRFRSADWFLFLWLGGELVAAVMLSPFMAVRRVLGVLVVATLLTGRLVARTCRTTPARTLVWTFALLNVALGMLFYAVDFREAQTDKEAAETAVRWIRAQDAPPDATVWYAGHWGFQFYSERAAMQPVVPGKSQLRRGDWLVVPDWHIHQQQFGVSPDWAKVVAVHEHRDPFPLATVWCYYSGSTALEHWDGPRLVVTIYRVVRDHLPVYEP